MAKVHPFRAYRYSPSVGPLDKLLTQPYDKISPEMQRRYYSNHDNNLVRVILGEKLPSDTEADSVYTRAAGFFRQWTSDGTLVRDAQPSFYAYFQEFELSDEPGVRYIRKGFIGLGDIVDYPEGIVFRHELTFPGPKKDRRQVLEATLAHFGQIFMIYPDPMGVIDQLLDEAATSDPAASVLDEYGVLHRLWPIVEPSRIAAIQQAMADKQLIIADGHHRYETALGFSRDHPETPGSGRVMMTFVNMYSPGLKILGTHRVIRSLPGFELEPFLRRLERQFKVTRFPSLFELRKRWNKPHPTMIEIGALFAGNSHAYLFELKRQPGDLDVRVLHEAILQDVLGIAEDTIRKEDLLYVRGVEAAAKLVQSEGCPAAFLLEPPSIDQVADISFNGGVMPQKSTDFYPKLLTGMAIYRLEK